MLRATDAARMVGLSYDNFRRLIESGEIAAERDGRYWVVDRASLDAWVAAHQMAGGMLAPTCAAPPHRTNVELLDAVRALSGWDTNRLSAVLGVSVARIEQWAERGVSNPYVRRLWALLDEPKEEVSPGREIWLS